VPAPDEPGARLRFAFGVALSVAADGGAEDAAGLGLGGNIVGGPGAVFCGTGPTARLTCGTSW